MRVLLDGAPVARMQLHVPHRGAWWADVVLEGDAPIGRAVVLDVDGEQLRGTAVRAQRHAIQGHVRVVGGGGGWGSLLSPKAYHNDAGVQPATVAEDAARDAGERLGDWDSAIPRPGVDYVRQAGPASRALEEVIAGRNWWVGFDGRTHVGQRASDRVREQDCTVLDYDPAAGRATLDVLRLAGVRVGMQLAHGLPHPGAIRELSIAMNGDSLQVTATVAEGNELAPLFRSLVKRCTDGRLYGKYRYRVFRMASGRVELQAVSRRSGLPDVLPVSMTPGVAGAHSELTQGAEVLVEFVEGLRAMPIVSAFGGLAAAGHVPVETVLNATGTLHLGDRSATQPAALAPAVDAQFNAVYAALDALANAGVVAQDGGAALKTAFAAAWHGAPIPAVPPMPPATGSASTSDSDVGASKVRIQ